MATINIERGTLLDMARVLDPDGTPAQVIEILNQSNPILQQAPAYPSNAPMGHRVTFRSSLPQVEFAKVNQGATRSKGSTRQVQDTMGFVQGLSEVDSKLLKLMGPTAFAAKRASEDAGFLEAMSQLIASTMIYGDEKENEAAFTGLAPRMPSLVSAITGSQVISAGAPGGGDTSSLYVIDWGDRGAKVIYPASAGVGIDSRDLGEQRVDDEDGKSMSAFVQVYEWVIGLSVEDPRHIARVANIDISDANLAAPTQTLLANVLDDVLSGMAQAAGCTRVIYAHRKLCSAFRKQAKNGNNVYLSMAEYLGHLEPHFWGVPVVRLDAIVEDEGAAITA